MKFDSEKIKARVLHAPLHYMVPAIVLVLVLVLAIARLIWFNHRAPAIPVVESQAAPAPAPAPAASVSGAKLAAVPTSTPSAASAPVATSSVAPQANAVMTEPPIPGAAAPQGLVQMKALYVLETSPTPPGNAPATWSEIGHKVIDARAANFQTLSEKDLDQLLPTSGQVRESWTFWVSVDSSGSWVTAMKAGGFYHASVSVEVDGLDVPALSVKPWNNVSNVVAQLRLGVGWHQVTIRFVQQIREAPAEMHGTVELFWRGPTDSAPTAIIPGAVDPAKAQINEPEASDGERSGAPAGAMSSGPATAANPASSAHGGVK